MDALRRAELAASLKSRLESDTQGYTRLERLRWLFAHLNEYLERWIAFSGAEYMSMACLVESDLHGVLLIALDVIDKELDPSLGSERFQQEWRSFAALVRAIDSQSKKELAEELQNRLCEVSSALAACTPAAGD